MLDWVRHFAKVWYYGAGLLLALGAFAFLWISFGGLAYLGACELFGWRFSGTGWFISSALVAPFTMPQLAEAFAGFIRRDPPPSALDLERKRWGSIPRR